LGQKGAHKRHFHRDGSPLVQKGEIAVFFGVFRGN
jgi:hypothetical protein